jgi:hypothetical protein
MLTKYSVCQNWTQMEERGYLKFEVGKTAVDEGLH